MDRATLKIGEVARRAGVAVDTVRYYERLGVLPGAARKPSGYRLFDESAVERIALVKQLQALGLSLEDIGALVEAVTLHGAKCAEARPRVQSALEHTEQRIAELQRVRRRLRAVLARCEKGECEVVERIKRGAPRGRG